MKPLDAPSEGSDHFEAWAFGGGKGGTGKSALAASVGFHLASMGKRVILVDADFGGANLHTSLGVPPPKRSLLDLIRQGGALAADPFVAATPYPNLRIIGGRVDEAPGKLSPGWASRLFSALRAVSVDVAILDLPAGVSPDTVQLMDVADLSVFVSVPEPSSTENVATLLRSLCLQRLMRRLPSSEVRKRLIEIQGGQTPGRVRVVADMLREVEAIDRSLVASARAIIDEMALTLVTNQARDHADRQAGAQTAAVIRRHHGLPMCYAGFVRYDDSVWRTLRRGRAFMDDASRSRAADDVRRLTRNLLLRADLSPAY